jgi:threonine synthase
MEHDSLVIATCGNFGAAFSHLAKDFGMETHVYIPAGFHTERIDEIESLGGVIHRVKGTYEDAVRVSSLEAKKHGWFNANPGEKINTEAAVKGYAGIAYEIFRDLGRAPDVVTVPVGNGTTLAGVYQGFKILRDDGKADKVPRMIAASTSLGNPIIRSFVRGQRTIQDLSPSEIKETSLNEPLVNWHSFDGQIALDALWESDGWAVGVSDSRMIAFSRLIAREEGLLTLPASASALAAISGYLKKKDKVNESCVAVITARKFIRGSLKRFLR